MSDDGLMLLRVGKDHELRMVVEHFARYTGTELVRFARKNPRVPETGFVETSDGEELSCVLDGLTRAGGWADELEWYTSRARQLTVKAFMARSRAVVLSVDPSMRLWVGLEHSISVRSRKHGQAEGLAAIGAALTATDEEFKELVLARLAATDEEWSK